MFNLRQGLRFAMTERYCIRCTVDMNGEEKYFLLGAYYCEACIDTIQNDPSWPIHMKQLEALASLKQIEV